MKNKLLLYKEKLSSWFQKKEQVPIENMEEITCGNCETVFKGNYCPQCGQSKKELDRPLSFVMYDFMGTVFAFDNRFFRTMFTILVKPGRLSQDFLDGKRARYMPPFKFYIFVSFIFFLLMNVYTKRELGTYQDEKKQRVDSVLVNTKFPKEIKNSLENPKNSKDSLILAVLDSVEVDEMLFDTALSGDAKQKVLRNKIQLFVDDLIESAEFDSSATSVEEKKWMSRIRKMNQYPDVFISKALRFTSWSVFILMPFFALLLRLFFIRKRYNYIRHFIFSVNVHAFNFFVFSVIMCCHLFFEGDWLGITHYLLWLGPIFLVVGAVKFYKQSIAKTIIKLFFLITTYIFVILGAIVTVLAFAAYYV